MAQEPAAPNRIYDSPRIDKRALALLSAREEQVLSLAAAGFLDKQISVELGLSLNTLRTYWTRIRAKVGEGSRSALAVAYIEQFPWGADGNAEVPDWEIDLVQRTWRRVSDRFLPLIPTERNLSLDEALSRFHPDDRPRIEALLRDLDEATTFQYAARILTPDGYKTTGAFVRVVRDTSGLPTKLIGHHTPLLDLRSDHSDLIKSVRHEGWVYDPRSGHVMASDAINNLHGLACGVPHTREEYGPRFNSEDYANGLRVMDEIAAGKFETSNFKLRPAIGIADEFILITVHGIRDRHGQVTQIVGFRTSTHHGTADKPATTKVKVGFWAKDLRSGTFIVPDDDFCRIYRVDPKSPTLDEDIRSRYDTKDLDDAYAFIDRAVADGQQRGSREFKLHFEDGTHLWVRLECFIERDAQGPYRASGTVLASDGH